MDEPQVTCPEGWTPERVEEFRKAWDEYWATAREHRLIWLPPGPGVKPRQQVTLHLKWTEDGNAREDLFGPWTALADGDLSHMEAAHSFIGDFCRVTGIQPDEATAVLILDPEEWLREREQREALPMAARDGTEALADVCKAMGAGCPRDLTPYGSVIIEWAPPYDDGRPMPGWKTAIYDTVTGEVISTVMHARIIDADASRSVTADLTMFADEDGSPVFGGKPHIRDGEPVTGVFRFDVSGMRVRES